MKLGVISDVHANASALETVLYQLRRQEVDRIVCAGDIVGYYPQAERVIRLLQIANVDCVMGNHDEAVLGSTPMGFNVYARRAADWTRRNLSEESLNFLKSLPLELNLSLAGKEVYVVHGSPREPTKEYVFQEQIDRDFLNYHFEDPPDVVIFGHTHLPFIKQVERTLILNPGSVGQPRDGNPMSSYAVIDLVGESAEVHRAEYDIESVYQETIEHLPRKLADRLKEGE